VTDQPRHPHPRPGARHPRRPPAARRALSVLGVLLLSLAAATAMAPAALATPPPPEPPPGPPPPPPALPPPGLPLWAVLVILGGTITLAAAATLITLALHPTARRGPRPPARTPAKARHQPPPPARPATRQHTSAAIPAKDTGFVMACHAPPRQAPVPGHAPAPPGADPVAGPPDAEHRPSAARARGQLPLIPHHRRSS